jgi:WD40 repeat protein
MTLPHEHGVSAAVFSPADGRSLATASRDGTARVWEAASGRLVARLPHEGEVIALAFSPDGRYLATGSYDGTARIWEAASGHEVVRVQHDGPVEAVGFSPAGDLLVTTSVDGSARIWRTTPEESLSEACARLGRNLGRQEWTRLVGSEPYHTTCAGAPIPSG